MISLYYRLTKPGIIYGNALAAAAGFALASQDVFHPVLFVVMLFGISLIIACGCVLNNLIDRDIDALMERTKKRALVTGAITQKNAQLFALILGTLGTLTLGFGTNSLTLLIALAGLFFYVVVYSMWSKRHTLHATVIGAISGAVPPVVGYCAVTNSLDLGAFLLFIVLATWQIPHALAISIYRKSDYAAASIPVIPIARSMFETKLLMSFYVALYLVSLLALSYFSYTSYIFGATLGLLNALWFIYSLKGFSNIDDIVWGKKMFRYSLISLLAFCVMTVVDLVVRA